jgi:hypothetical protein
MSTTAYQMQPHLNIDRFQSPELSSFYTANMIYISAFPKHVLQFPAAKVPFESQAWEEASPLVYRSPRVEQISGPG